MYTQAALFASMRIVEKVEEFAAANGKKVLYALSYGPNNVRKSLEGGSRFDQQFVDFLAKKGLRYVDLLDRHVTDYSRFKPGVREYLDRYFIGHYSAAGNAFYAAAVRDSLLEMLQPTAPAYREQ
jgi:hypothetical protein